MVAASADAASELLRSATLRSEGGASFGWHRATPGRLAAELARAALIELERVPVSRLGVEAVVARVVHERAREGLLGRYAAVWDKPGFATALAAVLEDLRLAAVASEALSEVEPELRGLERSYESALEAAGLADRAFVFGLAAERVRRGEPAHAWIGLPLLLLDVPLWTEAGAALFAELVARSPDALATAPAGDRTTAEHLERIGFRIESLPAEQDATSITRVQQHLFEESAPPELALGDDVILLSAPGESRECVEIARRLLACSREGIPFDRMAILLRSPEEYRPHLEEALGRARIPAHFARGAILPDPAGRAFLALLGCAREGLSARRFAEYLSLGELPDATRDGEPPPAPPDGERFVAPDEELVPEVVAEAMARARTPEAPELSAASHVPRLESDPVVEGTLRAPRRWEQLIVDAAVIGGRERWERRLAGLARELEHDLEELDDPEGPQAAGIHRRIDDLAALRRYALPLLSELDALPGRASWGEWLERLSSLATRALRRPERVLAVLSELVPMAGVGPVPLSEVHLVLSRRLLEAAVPPPRSRHGCVLVAPVDAARGMAFDVACVPGLAEKLFPRPVREEPILLDRARSRMGCGLVTNEQRVARERLALRIAVGAATRRLVLTYPRLDLEKGRPRVPSFYALEALRAGEGRLPGFGELARRAETRVQTRVGWPAPPDPALAIDEAEHDLALLQSILARSEPEAVGTARYLLSANPHLGRALRFRARRWLRRWTPADGLVEPCEAAAEALRRHDIASRSYSATALEDYAQCPYRFFLQAIQRLAPREVPVAIDELDPLQRGSLVHRVQFELLGRLQREGLLPVTPQTLESARGCLDAVLDAVAARFREELAPAIERVWTAGVEDVRADLREWLRRMSEDASGFVPWRFELGFGLGASRERDPESIREPAALDCGITLRGSIDLLELQAGSRIRVTDHKTGRARMPQDGVLAGGKALQPVLYSLAAEKLFPALQVVEGRLSYCTAAGGFEVRGVPLGGPAREGAERLAQALGGALAEGFLPAYPERNACRFCDYRVVCGPYEESRTARKPRAPAPLAALEALRKLP